MQSLNLRDEEPAREDQAGAPPEEPLGLDLIRGWIAKPRPRLYRLWLWVPLTTKAIRKAYRWLRVNTGPGLRRAAEQARKARVVIEACRRLAARLAQWLRKTFPPGSRGHETAAHFAEANRLLGRAALALFRTRRGLDDAADLLEPEPPAPEHERKPVLPERQREPAPPERERRPDRPPREAEPAPPGRTPAEEAEEEAAPPGRMLPRAADLPRKEPRRRKRPASDPTGSAPAASSRYPGVPPGPRADALAKLSTTLRGQILGLGERPRKAALRYVIWRILNECGETTSENLGLLLHVDAANLAKRHLSPLVEEGALERTIPDRLNHPDQAYRSTRWAPGAHHPPPGDG